MSVGIGGREVEPVGGAHRLAARVDHRVHRAQERVRGVSGSVSDAYASHISATRGARIPSRGGQPTAHASPRSRTKPGKITGATYSAPGSESSAEDPAHLAAEPAAAHEHQALASSGCW